MKELPCKKVNCELLRRLRVGITPAEFTLSMNDMEKQAEELGLWFQERDISPSDGLGIMEILKAACWEAIAKTN